MVGQLAQHEQAKQAHKAYRSTQFDPAEAVVHFYRSGHDHDVVVEPMAEQQQATHERHHAYFALHVAVHQQSYRCHEIDDNIQPEPKLVLGLPPLIKVNGFFGDIRIIDEHKLRKPDISPEDGKPKNELA